MRKSIFKILLLTVLLFPLSARTSPAQGIYDWSSIKNGTNGVVNAITVYNNKIVIGGSFTQVGGVPANNVAQWDGVNWQQVGTGFTDEVYSLTVFNGNLIAAGKYLLVTPVDTARIFSYNGSAWQPLGKGFVNRTNEYVTSLLVHQGSLYAAGLFKLNFTAGGASNVAVLTGSNWTNLGDGLDLEVMCMTSDGTDIIAGGKFSSSDTAQVNHIARWNNSKWNSLGSGLNGNVHALTTFNNEIIAGGEFPGYISRFSGSWQVLGNGVSDTVKSLVNYQNNLIVGGSFRSAGLSTDSLYVNGIAGWNGSLWAPLRTGMNKDVRALFTDSNRLYAGGAFISAGGDSVNHIAYWDTIQTIIVSGNVNYVGGPNVISGVAKSVRYDTYTRGIIYYDSSQVQPDGSYQVRIPKDKPARIIIYSDDEDLPTFSYIPTYYPATIYWENATIINQSTNGTGFDVEVERITNPTTNTGSISGKVFLDYTPPGYTNANNLDIKSGAIVYARIDSSWKAFGISNRFEDYTLGNLPAGSYQLIVNRLGYTTQVKNNVVLATGQQLTNINFTLTISDGGSVNISGNTTIIPDNYNLLQNYPNPFNPVSKIKFELPVKGIVNLKVYNTAGQLVSELLNEQVLSAGVYTAEFDGGNLASGVYFYRLEVLSESSGVLEFSGSKKMILIK